MIWKIIISCTLMIFMCGSSATAKDEMEKYSIQEAFQYNKVSTQFDGSVSFFWGNQSYPPVVTKFRSYKTSKRTSLLSKERDYACSLAMAEALKTLEERALKEGGNAIINIVSNVNNIEESSDVDFTCMVGRVVVNVALKGMVVTIGQ